MRPEHCRMLNVNSPCSRWIDDTPPDTRKNRLRPHDVAHALAKLSPAAAMYACVAYAEQDQYTRALIGALRR